MSEANKTTVRRFVAALGSGDVEALRALMTEDIEAVCTGTSLMAGTRRHADIVGAAALLGQMTKAGINFHIVELTAEADRVSAEIEGQSTLVNGQSYNNQFYLRDGKVCRMKEYMDSLLVENTLGPLVRAAAGSG
jgi:uncharacterized protein